MFYPIRLLPLQKEKMPTRDEVERFLSQFFPKMEIWGIYFLYREKNIRTLAKWSIRAENIKQVIRDIKADDFVERIPDSLAGYGDLWVFGKMYEKKELYIKIALGRPSDKTICISFHQAEKPIDYLFK